MSRQALQRRIKRKTQGGRALARVVDVTSLHSPRFRTDPLLLHSIIVLHAPIWEDLTGQKCQILLQLLRSSTLLLPLSYHHSYDLT